MKKIIAVLAAVTMLLTMTAGVASAQAPTGAMEMSPGSVDAAGDVEFEITMSGFTAGVALFMLPCAAPAGGDMAAFDAATACDQSQLTPVAIGDDGTASATATYSVTDDGLVVVAGDADRTEFGIAIIPPPGAGDAAAADDAGDAELAETGVETGLLALIAVTMVAGGAMVVSQMRRYS